MKLLDEAVLPTADDWHRVGHHIVRETPAYAFALEDYRSAGRQMVFVHLHVKAWSKKTLKVMKHEFNLFRQCVQVPLYAVSEVGDDKWASFVSFFGFRKLTDVVCENGEKRPLYIHLKGAASAAPKEEQKDAKQSDAAATASSTDV